MKIFLYSFTRTRPPHQILNVCYNPDAPSALDFFMYARVSILLYSANPDAQTAPDSVAYLIIDYSPIRVYSVGVLADSYG